MNVIDLVPILQASLAAKQSPMPPDVDPEVWATLTERERDIAKLFYFDGRLATLREWKESVNVLASALLKLGIELPVLPMSPIDVEQVP